MTKIPKVNIAKNLKELRSRKYAVQQKLKDDLDKVANSIKELELKIGVILSLSKEAMNFSIQGNRKLATASISRAYSKIVTLEKDIKNLRKKLADYVIDSRVRISDLQGIKLEALEAGLASAKEEFLEAKLLTTYLASGKIFKPDPKNTIYDFDHYAGALSDFCGELVRKARSDATKKQSRIADLRRYEVIVNEVHVALSHFAFSNRSGVRTKLEQLKNHVSNLEEVLYSHSKAKGII